MRQCLLILLTFSVSIGVRLLCDGTCAETRFHLLDERSSSRTSPGVNGHSAVGRQGMHVGNSVCASAGVTFLCILVEVLDHSILLS